MERSIFAIAKVGVEQNPLGWGRKSSVSCLVSKSLVTHLGQFA